MQQALRWIAIAGLLSLGACQPKPWEACDDLVMAFGDSVERCGFDREINESEFEAGATMGMGCNRTDRIRDIDDFYDVCIPFIEGLTCSELETGFDVPDECVEQLLFEI